MLVPPPPPHLRLPPLGLEHAEDVFAPAHDDAQGIGIWDVHGTRSASRGGFSAELSVRVRASREQSRARAQVRPVPRTGDSLHVLGGVKTAQLTLRVRAERGNASRCMQEERVLVAGVHGADGVELDVDGKAYCDG